VTILPADRQIALGYNSGFVRWFSFKGDLHDSHRLHDTAVHSLVSSALTIVYQDGLIVILRDGPHHLESAERYRCPVPFHQLHLLPYTASRGPLFSSVLSNQTISALPSLKAHGSRFLVTGKSTDQLEAPFMSLVVVKEGQPTASALANKVASTVSSAMFSLATTLLPLRQQDQQQQGEAVLQLYPVLSLVDPKRESHVAVVMAHDRTPVAAVADNLGRVCLVDLNQMEIVRMWKGYRDAQVGFHTVQGSMCLIIYAPRRQRMEMYALRRAPRLSVWQVPAEGRLISAVSETGQAFTQFMSKSGEVYDFDMPSTDPSSLSALRRILVSVS
jgi:hypothetical protein